MPPKLFALEGDTTNHRKVIAAGPLSIQPYTLPFRTVLCIYTDGTMVVCDQVFEYGSDMTPPPMTMEDLHKARDHFGNGSYFKEDELVKAVECFASRVSDKAPFLGSLYRDGPLVVSEEPNTH